MRRLMNLLTGKAPKQPAESSSDRALELATERNQNAQQRLVGLIGDMLDEARVKNVMTVLPGHYPPGPQE